MKNSILLFCFAALLSLSSCMDTKYVTKKTTFDRVVSQVRDEMAQQGFDLTGSNTETKNDLVVVHTSRNENDGVSSELKNNYVTRDTYQFTNAQGNKVSYTVSYQVKETKKGEPYVDGVEVVGCEVSIPADYDKLCGVTSPTHRIATMDKDQRIRVLNGTKTVILAGGITLVGLILLFASN